MTYVIGEPCVDVLDRTCVEECPVDCIYEGERMLYIHPDECVDCGACEPVCPVEAIYYEDDLPDKWRMYAGENARFFAEPLPGRDEALGSPGGAAKLGVAGADAVCRRPAATAIADARQSAPVTAGRLLRDPDIARIMRRSGSKIAPDGGPLTTTGWQRIRQWRQEWLALPSQVVPAVTGTDQAVRPGIEGLRYLADLASTADLRPHPPVHAETEPGRDAQPVAIAQMA